MDWTFSNRYTEGPEEFEDPPAWGAIGYIATRRKA